MQRFSDNLPRIAEVASLVSGRTHVTFHTQPGASLLLAGVIEPSTTPRHGLAQEYYQRSAGSPHFGTMPLAIEDRASTGEVMSGLDWHRH